ncbi:hypothetical protein VUJ46_07335 [Chryseobacterium sp. MYb264]|uniref:hypothetical protein n=1 Tax=Chryseobacterium sp. MYb264 TaxID=2745153 RepID=UPI002E0F1A7E|nr:hypothetical protein VUJ46_07335 [Chryseobacterium sp. MYb264]
MIAKEELKPVSLSTIFSWFERGDMPTESQFQQTFSSFRLVEEKLKIDEVEGLREALEEVPSDTNFLHHLQDENAHNAVLAGLNASNLTTANVNEWREKLKINLSATIDGLGEIGNVYTKAQIEEIANGLRIKDNEILERIERITQILNSDDINLDDLQEIVVYIKENRQQIEFLTNILAEGSADDKIKLTGVYSNWGKLSYQNEFNDSVYDKIQDIEEDLRAVKVVHEEMVKKDVVIKHDLNTFSFIIDAYDTVTMFTMPLKVKRIDRNSIEVLFDSLPPNMIQLTIKKI